MRLLHGWRWIDYQNVSKPKEKTYEFSHKVNKENFWKRPSGWYTGRCSPNTLDLVIEEGGFYIVVTLIVMTCLIGKQKK